MVLISGYEAKVKFCFLVITYIKGEEDRISDLFLALVFFEPTDPWDSNSQRNHSFLGLAAPLSSKGVVVLSLKSCPSEQRAAKKLSSEQPKGSGIKGYSISWLRWGDNRTEKNCLLNTVWRWYHQWGLLTYTEGRNPNQNMSLEVC